jgi:hypothetical protein
MNSRSLASVARKAIVSRKSKAAVNYIIDDDQSVRAALDSPLDPDSADGAINLTVSSRRVKWARPVPSSRR